MQESEPATQCHPDQFCPWKKGRASPWLARHYSSPIAHMPLIMLTSLAPSPMASVTTFLYLFTSSTTWAF